MMIENKNKRLQMIYNSISGKILTLTILTNILLVFAAIIYVYINLYSNIYNQTSDFLKNITNISTSSLHECSILKDYSSCSLIGAQLIKNESISEIKIDLIL